MVLMGTLIPIRIPIMSKKQTKNRNTRKLSRIGPRSLGVIIPAEILDDLKWREKQRLIIKRTRGGGLIKVYPITYV